MRKRNYKGRCVKKFASKVGEVCRTYDDIQLAYLDEAQNDPEIRQVRCNIPFESAELEVYSTDFLCVKSDGDLMVRECVFRRLLTRPRTAKLLDASRVYWLKRGVTDWGLVIDAEK